VRVLLVSNQYAPVIGGIEVFLRQLAPTLQARGHEVAVLTGMHADATAPHEVLDGTAVFRTDIVRAVARKDPFAIARCRRAALAAAAEFAPDVIHAHDSGPNLWAVAVSGVPLLATVHSSTALHAPEQLGPIARQLAQCGWATGVSQSVADDVVALVPSLAGRVSVVANGVSVPTEPPVAHPGGRNIVAAGRMVPEKGFDVLLHAFAQIAALDADARLRIVGDGPLRSQLVKLAATLGVANRVDMSGAVRHTAMKDVFATASVVAMPSRLEGMPLVALEAAVAARPVVATPVQGVVIHGETGLLVPPDDATALADAISELLNDPVRSSRLGEAARRHVIANHSMSATTDAYEALYRRVISPPR